jgi:hypothetical protein
MGLKYKNGKKHLPTGAGFLPSTVCFGVLGEAFVVL